MVPDHCVLTTEMVGENEEVDWASCCRLQVSTPLTDMRVDSLNWRVPRGTSSGDDRIVHLQIQ